MRRAKPYHLHSTASVRHPTALDMEWYDDAEAAVRLFRDWLAGEGADPGRWADLARSRAERLLADDDTAAVFCAAEFLRNHGGDRAAAAARVAAVLDELKPGPTPYSGLYRGKPAAVPEADWSKLLAGFGKLARPHARVLIRVQTDQGANAWAYYAWLREVAGDEVMAHLFAALPRVSAEVAKLKADPATPQWFTTDDPRGWWFSSLREVQLACDRWAGRRFDTDAARVAWWAANRGRRRADWLAKNLATVMEQADAGDPWAGWVAREVVPALPEAGDPHRGRAKWLAENRARLRYDPDGEVFRLDGGGR